MALPEQDLAKQERRSSQRHEVMLHALFELPGARPLRVTVHDISAGGCGAESSRDLVPGTRAYITLPGLGRWPTELVWSRSLRAGVRFQVTIHTALADILRQGCQPNLRGSVARLATALGMTRNGENATPEMSLAAQVAVVTADDRRSVARRLVNFGASVREIGASLAEATVTDLSIHGCRLSVSRYLSEGAIIWVKIAGVEAVEARVAWANGEIAGCAYSAPLHPKIVEGLSLPEVPRRPRVLFGPYGER